MDLVSMELEKDKGRTDLLKKCIIQQCQAFLLIQQDETPIV